MIITTNTEHPLTTDPLESTTNRAENDEFSTAIKRVTQELGIEDIEILPLRINDTSNITPNNWGEMIDVIANNYDKYDSFVVTHSKNTLGYTCAVLSFAFDNIGKLVIVTGSQIPFNMPGTDAVMNLESAIKVAVDDKHKLFGVAEVFGSQIISGVRVRKTSAFDYDGLTSFNSHPLGSVGRVIRMNREALDTHLRFHTSMAKEKSKLVIHKEFDINIVSITEFPGMKSDFIVKIVNESNVRGIIFRTVGLGDPNVFSSEGGGESIIPAL